MTAVLLDDRRDERRLPQRRKTVALRRRGEAVVKRVDEHHAPVLENTDVMRIEFAGDVGFARHIAGIEHIVDLLAFIQHVLEPHDLEQRRQQDGVLVGNANPHRLAEEALVDQEPAIDVLSQQVELARLIGRDRERDPLRAEEAGQARRHRIGDARFGRNRLRLGSVSFLPGRRDLRARLRRFRSFVVTQAG